LFVCLGDATAMYQLGVLKMETQDIDLSVHWWQKAAERGCAEAYIQVLSSHNFYSLILTSSEQKRVNK
jgi:TPR repeat protein